MTFEVLQPRLLHHLLHLALDYVDILAEIVQNRLNNADLSAVFPDFTPSFHGITV